MNHQGNNSQKKGSALIVFSGGQDSTTCLAWAQDKFEKVMALSFDYDQRHRVELLQAAKICRIAGVDNEILKVDVFTKLSTNALTHEVEINAENEKQLPSTFVPGRNLIFLSLAAAKAYQYGVNDIVTGVCQTDFSGYPDCRDEFIKSLEKTISLAMDTDFKIHTPLMWKTKAESVLMMQDLGRIRWLKDSHTCYEGIRPACGNCPACKLRLKGFKEAGVEDPLEYK